jgi:hypothetical protein
MKSTFNLLTVLACLFGATAFGQTTYSTSVNAAGGQNYSVNVTITPTAIVPAQSSCAWGYNYDVAYDYDVQITGGNNSSLYTLAGYLTCGSNQGIYFDLPNNGGSGSDVTQGNSWNNNSDCATATVESLLCDSIAIQIEGPGIPNQFISLPPNNNNGGGQEWDMDGNNADTTNFIGTTNSNPLIMRTNNVERMRITEDGKFGVGISNPLEKFELQGNLKLTGDVIFSDYVDQTDTIDRFLTIDENGRTKSQKMNELKSSLYATDCYIVCCDDDVVAKTTVVGLTLPTWANSIDDDRQILYTGVSCPTWVGIGTALPDATLDVIGDARFTNGVRIGNQDGVETALHIENSYIGSGKNMFEDLIIVKDHENNKVLQLHNNGLLRAREIKVDEAAWPDYVFKPNYELMPLNKVKAFIAQNGHLPNVPSAKEIESDGVNLGKTAKLTMEKVEELTLYLIGQQEQLDEQKELLEKQRLMLEEQRREIEKLKKN